MKGLILALLATSVLVSCRFLGGERIHGNGNIVNVQRNVGSFNSIDAGGAVEVHVKQDAANSLRVETDENLFSIQQASPGLLLRRLKFLNLLYAREVLQRWDSDQFRNRQRYCEFVFQQLSLRIRAMAE